MRYFWSVGGMDIGVKHPKIAPEDFTWNCLSQNSARQFYLKLLKSKLFWGGPPGPPLIRCIIQSPFYVLWTLSTPAMLRTILGQQAWSMVLFLHPFNIQKAWNNLGWIFEKENPHSAPTEFHSLSLQKSPHTLQLPYQLLTDLTV